MTIVYQPYRINTVMTSTPTAMTQQEVLLSMEVGAAKRYPLKEYYRLNNARARVQRLHPGTRFRLRRKLGVIYLVRLK